MSERTRYPSAEACPDVKRHTKCPNGYIAWHQWADRKERTHISTRCSTCGFFAIWLPKAAGKDAGG